MAFGGRAIFDPLNKASFKHYPVYSTGSLKLKCIHNFALTWKFWKRKCYELLLFLLGNGGAGEGLPSTEPDVTLTLSVSDMQNMFMGNIKPLQVYMSGRLKVSGDLSAAINIEDFVKRVVDKMKSDSRENDGRLQYV